MYIANAKFTSKSKSGTQPFGQNGFLDKMDKYS